jgi:diguanylate cyclase (GGDEF)-like protein
MGFHDDYDEPTSVGHRALNYAELNEKESSTRPVELEAAEDTSVVADVAALVQIYGHDLGRRYDFLGEALTIGRGAVASIRVRDDTASRVHCEIVPDGERYVLRDLGATNHTFVNDQREVERALENGDVVRVGSHLFKFLSGAGFEAAYYDEVHRVMQTDSLTAALNRRGFDAELERLWYTATRYGRSFSILMIDIDLFKRVNDTYGHRFGDFVLSHLSALCLEGKRYTDAFCRYGGEEFAFLLAETTLPGALMVAERLRSLIEGASFVDGDTRTPVTISIGVATYEAEVSSKEELVSRADACLYEAKRAGRNRVRPTISLGQGDAE